MELMVGFELSTFQRYHVKGSRAFDEIIGLYFIYLDYVPFAGLPEC